MRTIETRFADMQRRRPMVSTLLNFGAAVKGGKFKPRMVSYWFNRLVEKDDFEGTPRREILKHVNALSGSRPVGRDVKFRVRRAKVIKATEGAGVG
ncbi:hypothetical protein A2704_05600 [Candidatus Kaiserbacteria bacterium RIFCSPHIGHO2_01_FULL_54_36b]|uniref:Uncharacterized protein n=1 Tax=Candidatus Kaiserbacteria bacterium RIFCSPHIGHO2_01_FULL_54_36b TaxID=1798483 RepID=A0A1F6CND5_9BACT|nr:MAG: hypothetical protein A2704_05600 [Candidatus Kaiserbacteria bacterium RIFCSPHIGHO2_01_FULL_54_36b]